jgi:hypothetical protein
VDVNRLYLPVIACTTLLRVLVTSSSQKLTRCCYKVGGGTLPYDWAFLFLSYLHILVLFRDDFQKHENSLPYYSRILVLPVKMRFSKRFSKFWLYATSLSCRKMPS